MKENNKSNTNASIILKNVYFKNRCILFKFNNLNYDAWLENTNKHIPEVHSLRKIYSDTLVFDLTKLQKGFVHSRLKLSIANNNERLSYSVTRESLKIVSDHFFHLNLFYDDSGLCFDIVCKGDGSVISHLNSAASKRTSLLYPLHGKITTKPRNVCVIGSCFTRSVFQSNSYFNPDYKKHFNVLNTFFHNSIISMLSTTFTHSKYSSFKDLHHPSIKKYVLMEFDKNLEAILSEQPVQYLFVDNYSDAALPIVEMGPDCYLTYNRYFSESIFRKKFSDKQIIHPGSSLHIKLYEKSLIKLSRILEKLQLDKKIILVGGRLSIQKTDSEIWTDKIHWINEVNTCWDVYDSMFLNKFQSANYIDMRNSKWLSDLESPIKGGASPAHYQSNYYKHLYTRFKEVVVR